MVNLNKSLTAVSQFISNILPFYNMPMHCLDDNIRLLLRCTKLKEPLFVPLMGSNLFIGKLAFWFLIASAVR